MTPLALACDNGNPGMVKLLLAAGADPGAAVETGETTLMTCARTGDAEAVRRLLDAGADPNARESLERQTALMWAAAQGHADVVQLLIDHGADVGARSRSRRFVISRRLQSELRYGELGRSYGTDAEEDADRRLHAAALRGAQRQRGGGAEAARRRGRRQRHRPRRGERPGGGGAQRAPRTRVHAARSGHQPERLRRRLHGSARGVLTGDLAVVEALLARGASANAQVTLATKVTRNGQVLMIGEHLLGATPLALAAKFTEPDLMRPLAEAGADVRLPLKNGWTPLMLAAGAGWRYAVWDRRERTLHKTPAFQAQMYDEAGTLDTVRFLLDRGAFVNAVDEDGNTASTTWSTRVSTAWSSCWSSTAPTSTSPTGGGKPPGPSWPAAAPATSRPRRPRSGCSSHWEPVRLSALHRRNRQSGGGRGVHDFRNEAGEDDASADDGGRGGGDGSGVPDGGGGPGAGR